MVREGEAWVNAVYFKKVGDQLGRIGNLELIGVPAVDEALEYALEDSILPEKTAVQRGVKNIWYLRSTMLRSGLKAS